jgi:hypothetical protein
MNLEELAQPKQKQQSAQAPQQRRQPQPCQQPAQQQPKSMKIHNVMKVVVTNNGKVALVQLHGAREQMHYVKLPPGEVLQLTSSHRRFSYLLRRSELSCCLEW